jgi:predicted N-acetyltransferase YhbS
MDRSRIQIRLEDPIDHRTVEELTREAFWNLHVPGCDEHFLVHKLRDHQDFIPELDYVAVADDILVGNIMYCRSKIVLPDGRQHPVITFGPVSVRPDYQKLGIGSALIEHTSRAAASMGHESVFIYGNPAYYQRFGFRPAEAFQITTAEGKYHPALLVRELKAGALAGICGRFYESPVYHLDADEAAAFDATLPPKEKFVTESQRTFARLAGLPIPE